MDWYNKPSKYQLVKRKLQIPKYGADQNVKGPDKIIEGLAFRCGKECSINDITGAVAPPASFSAPSLMDI